MYLNAIKSSQIKCNVLESEILRVIMSYISVDI